LSSQRGIAAAALLRPGFDEHCTISLENFSSISGEYTLADCALAAVC